MAPITVGILIALAVGGFFFAMRSIEQGSIGTGETYRVYADLENVLGLAKRSRVVMAGIEVGFIDSIELVGDRARLHLRIRKDVSLFRDAALSKVSESLLGDRIITLSTGQDVEHPLQDGGAITNIFEEPDMSTVFRKLDGITGDIRDVTLALRNIIGTMDREGAMTGLVNRLNEIAAHVGDLTSEVQSTFVRSSDRIEKILGDVAGVTSGTRAHYGEILENIRVVSGDVRTLVANLKDIVGQGEEDWKQSVGGLKETLEKAGRSLENLDEISRKINEGQGTLGRLVNDDRILSKAEGVIDDASSFTSKLARLRTEIDLHTEFHVRQGDLKNYLALKLIPKSDKHYLMEVIDDPRGSVEVVRKCSSPEECQNGGTEEITVKDAFKFSVQFFKRYYFFGLRFGIIENSGGLGGNLFFFDDDLEVKFDVFQFGTNEWGEDSNPRLKAWATYHPSWLASHVYLTAGGDDFLNEQTFDFFLGAGLSFDDEDLKAIFTAVGTPKL